MTPVSNVVRQRRRSPLQALALLAAALSWSAIASAQCPYGSVQARVQPNVSTPWTQSLSLAAGQTFRVGGFYNHSGQLDTSGHVQLRLTHPNGANSMVANNSTVTASAAGQYTLRATCGNVPADTAVVNVTPPCPYSSIQTRVQPNVQTPWTQTLNLIAGQSFHVGVMYNNTGQFAPSGVSISVTGPTGFTPITIVNDSWVTTTVPGTYRVRGSCGALSQEATVNASTNPSNVDARRFLYGIGIAWASQWGLTGVQAEQWNLANLDHIVEAGGTNTHMSFDWLLLEPTRGQYNWAHADAQVRAAEERGLEMFGYTGNTPDWALGTTLSCTTDPNDPRYYRGWWNPPAQNERQAFRSFHTQLASRYCGRVKYYEFWNEPNGCSWMSCGCGDQSEAQRNAYAFWLREWYSAMKAGCQDTVLAVGGLDCNWGDDPNQPSTGCIDYVDKLYDRAAGNAFDAVALHPYGFMGSSQLSLAAAHSPNVRTDRLLNWPVVNGVAQVLANRGHAHKLLWLDEWAFNTSNDALKRRLVEATLDAFRSSITHPSVFQARYLTVTDIPAGSPYGLVDSSTSPVSLTPRGSWRRFRNKALGANRTWLGPWNPGMEFQGQPPSGQYSRIPFWGPAGAWAFHRGFQRPGHEVLGRQYGFYSAGTSETFHQTLAAQFVAGNRYCFSATVQGGGTNSGRLPMQIGYLNASGNFQIVSTRTVNATGAWRVRELCHDTIAGNPEVGRSIRIGFGNGSQGGESDIWFDNLLVTSEPIP